VIIDEILKTNDWVYFQAVKKSCVVFIKQRKKSPYHFLYWREVKNFNNQIHENVKALHIHYLYLA